MNRSIFNVCSLLVLMSGLSAHATDSAGVDSLNRACSEKLKSSSYKSAQPACDRALAAAAQMPRSPQYALALRNKSSIDIDAGNFTEADSHLHQALDIDTKGGTQQSAVDDYKALALMYQMQGRLGDAEAPLRTALNTVETQNGKDSPAAAELLTRLAQVYTDQHRYDDADTLLTRALAIDEKALGEQAEATVNARNELSRVRAARVTDGNVNTTLGAPAQAAPQ